MKLCQWWCLHAKHSHNPVMQVAEALNVRGTRQIGIVRTGVMKLMRILMCINCIMLTLFINVDTVTVVVEPLRGEGFKM